MTRNAEREAPSGTAAVPCLVIGWGSELRGDDAAGRRVVDRVAGWGLPGVETQSLHQLAPELAASLAAVQRVVFVDAYPAGAPDDEVCCIPVPPAAAPPGPGLGHHGDPAYLLQLSHTLYGRVPEAWLVGVPAHSFSLGSELSPQTARGVDGAATRVRALILADDDD